MRGKSWPIEEKRDKPWAKKRETKKEESQQLGGSLVGSLESEKKSEYGVKLLVWSFVGTGDQRKKKKVRALF